MSKPTAADTTDRQIAVRAAALYYADGAPPERCEHLLMLCEWIDAQRDEVGIQQALRSASDSYARLDLSLARGIASTARNLREGRSMARRRRALADADRIAAQHEPMVARICELSRAACEIPAILDAGFWRPDDDFYVDVVRQARPDLDAQVVKAISMICADRMTA